jgi:hypothetical protein
MRNTTVFLSVALAAGVAAGGRGEPAAQVSYSADVKPILEEHCVACHTPGGEGYEKSGLLMSSYDDLLKGTRHGPVIKPGDALSSTLVLLVEGKADESIRMPFHGAPLPEEKVAMIRDWVNQGAVDN